MKPTETPYTIDDECNIRNTKGETIATIQGNYHQIKIRPIDKTNARFIVKACNNYKPLVKALEKIRAEGTRCDLAQQDKPVREIYNIDEVDRIARLVLADIEKDGE